MRTAPLHITTVLGPGETGTVARVSASGELDPASAPRLKQALTAAAARCGKIQVDLSEVTFFDAAALRALEETDAAAPGRLRLMAASEPVHLVLRLLDMQHRFAGP